MPAEPLSIVPSNPLLPPPDPALLPLAAFSYDDRREVLHALSEAMQLCGCWLLERKPVSPTRMEFQFELQVHGVMELYAGLIAAGLELTRASHLELTGRCTVDKHHIPRAGLSSVMSVLLEVTFLEEVTLPAIVGTGAAHA